MQSYHQDAIIGYSPKEGHTVEWLKDKDGKTDHRVLLMTFNGKFLWSQFLMNEVKIKHFFDSVESEYIKLDRETGTYNTIGIIVDVTNIDLSLIRPLSVIQQGANSYIYTHKRAGEVVVVGIKKGYQSFSSSMMRVMFDLFIKAFPSLATRIYRAETVEAALNILKYQY